MSTSRPLRILCIHGYRQNAQTFKDKTGSFRKLLKKHAELEYITAPHRVPPGNGGSAAWSTPKEQSENVEVPPDADVQPPSAVVSGASDEDPGERGWWFSREDEYFKAVDRSDVSKGFDESVKVVVEALEKNKYDGIMGFSQGASLVSVLCLMQQQQGKDWFKFAVLIAAFKSRSTKHDVYYDGCKSAIPSLHVYGETDQVIPEDMSEELLQYFCEPRVLRHPGGHFVPASSGQKKGYITFFEDMKTI